MDTKNVLTPIEALQRLAHLYVEESEREKILHLTDTMTVGEFRCFFDYLFDGKAEIRIFKSNRRQLDNVMIKDILNPDRTDELVLSDTMTVAEAEKTLSSCFVKGCFVDIYPRNGGYKINKNMLLKDIRHLQAKLHDTFLHQQPYHKDRR